MRSATRRRKPAGEDCLPELAGEIERRAVVRDAVQHIVGSLGMAALVGRHGVPQQAEIGYRLDASARWIEPHNDPRREDIAVDFAIDVFQLVQAEDGARLAGFEPHALADSETLRIGEIDGIAAVAENEARAVVGQSPAVTRISHLALEPSGNVIDEDLVVLPSELDEFVIDDGKSLAEDGGAQVGQGLDLSGKRNGVEPRRAADFSGAPV